jgi:hypothetical protein
MQALSADALAVMLDEDANGMQNISTVDFVQPKILAF